MSSFGRPGCRTMPQLSSTSPSAAVGKPRMPRAGWTAILARAAYLEASRFDWSPERTAEADVVECEQSL
jgi:hypothetical protein